MKYCYMCKSMKQEENFYKDKSRPDGLSHRCKECDKERWRETYYPAHREKQIQRVTRYKEKRRTRDAEEDEADQKANQSERHIHAAIRP